MKKNIYFLVIITVLLISCNSESNKIEDYKNIFEITKDKSVKLGLPTTQFIVSYPDDIEAIPAKEGSYNPNYIEFFFKKDDDFHEGLAFGYYEGAKFASDFFNESLLNQLLGQFQSQLPNIEVVLNGKADFFGKELYQLQLQFEIVDEMYGSPGKYKMLLVLYPPDNDLTNGVLLIFQATEKSEIKSFGDFGKKGKTGEVWQTFRFTDV